VRRPRSTQLHNDLNPTEWKVRAETAKWAKNVARSASIVTKIASTSAPRVCSSRHLSNCRAGLFTRKSIFQTRTSYLHSRSFVVHSWFTVTPAFPSRLRVFASSRETNSPQTPLLAAAVRRQPVAEGRSRAGKPELPAFAFIRGSLVVHSASGGVSPLVTALTSVLWLQPQRRAAPSPSGETELSRPPRHATAVDGDSDLPLPHTRDATTLLCSTAYDDN
jgi:hypothetical protein